VNLFGKNQYTYQPHQIWPVSNAADSHSFFCMNQYTYQPHQIQAVSDATDSHKESQRINVSFCWAEILEQILLFIDKNSSQ
jgi:hypothetical protein